MRFSCRQVAWGMLGLKLGTLLLTGYAFAFNRCLWRLFTVRIAADVLLALLWVAVAVMPFGDTDNLADPGWQLYHTCWWSAVAIDMALSVWLMAPWAPRASWHRAARRYRAPVDLAFAVERLGLFYILSLGEVVVAAVAFEAGTTKGNATAGSEGHESGVGAQRYGDAAAAVCIVWCYKMLYFDFADLAEQRNPDFQHGQHPSPHAAAVSAPCGWLWELTHVPLNMATVLTGATVHEYVLGHHGLNRAGLAVAAGTVVLCISLLHATTAGMHPRALLARGNRIGRPAVRAALRLGTCALLMSLPSLVGSTSAVSDSVFLGLVTCLLVAGSGAELILRLPCGYFSRGRPRDWHVSATPIAADASELLSQRLLEAKPSEPLAAFPTLSPG